MQEITRNKEKAYLGPTGKKREAFCVDLILKKQKIFEEFRASQAEAVAKSGETITCGKGCSLCCCAYMQASLQECEAIVYYLYQDEEVARHFLANYPSWRQRLKEGGDIFKECGELWQDKMKPGAGEVALKALDQAEKRYLSQGIYCPFLREKECSIYAVRPLTCAALVATTPPEWCVPGSGYSAKMYVSKNPAVFDTSFYYNKLDEVVLGFMPLVVYGILEGGYGFLSNVPGLEGLEQAAI